MDSLTFASILRQLEKLTPLTDAFENACDENDQRLYGQRDDRWWDDTDGGQRQHLICWFSSKYYGGTERCAENCQRGERPLCASCWFEKCPETPPRETDAGRVFERMSRPEMYICLAEMLNLLEQDVLEAYINETKRALEEKTKWRDVRRKYITWDMVCDKIEKQNQN